MTTTTCVHRLTIAALILVATLFFGAAAADEVVRQAGAASIEWKDLRGRTVRLDDYRGRIIVLNFWATWCGPCRKEMPDLARIQREYSVYGVQVVGAAADAPEEGERVLGFARRHRVNFPVVLGATTEQMEQLGVGVGLPATAVIDADGQVVDRTRGIINHRDLAGTLDRLLDRSTADSEAHRHGDKHPEDEGRSEGDADSHGDGGSEAKEHPHSHGKGTTEASLVPS